MHDVNTRALLAEGETRTEVQEPPVGTGLCLPKRRAL